MREENDAYFWENPYFGIEQNNCYINEYLLNLSVQTSPCPWVLVALKGSCACTLAMLSCVLYFEQQEANPEPVCHFRPAPPADKPVFHPELPHRKTAVQPFNFESRYENKPTRQDIVESELKRQEEEFIKVIEELTLVCLLVDQTHFQLLLYFTVLRAHSSRQTLFQTFQNRRW